MNSFLKAHAGCQGEQVWLPSSYPTKKNQAHDYRFMWQPGLSTLARRLSTIQTLTRTCLILTRTSYRQPTPSRHARMFLRLSKSCPKKASSRTPHPTDTRRQRPLITTMATSEFTDQMGHFWQSQTRISRAWFLSMYVSRAAC